MTCLFRTPLRAAIAGVTLTLGASLAVAGPTGVPFKATFITQEVLRLDPVTCPVLPYLSGVTTGTGTASHLGATTGVAIDCITPSSPTSYTFSNGSLTFVSANGDQVWMAYRGALTPTATPPIYSVNGTYRIAGGTGRFATATGTGTLTGITNLQTGQGQLAFDGTISY